MIKYREIEEQIMRYSDGIPLSTKAEKEFKRIPVSITCDVCGHEYTLDLLMITKFLMYRTLLR
jgi:ribosomal protein L44E